MTDRTEAMDELIALDADLIFPLREEIARALADADGLVWDEVCGLIADPDDGWCDSSTCLAAHWEEHDIDQAQRWYLHLADALLPIITRERERAARAALEAAGDRIADFQKPVREMCLAEPFSDARIVAMMALEKAEIEARALSPADIVKGMK